MRRVRSQLGQTAAEYVGVLLLVSVVIAGVAHNDIGHRIGCQMRGQVAKILGGEAPHGCGRQRSGPRAVASAASANRDTDKDGIPDAEEIRRGTDPYASDTDHDGVSDKDEIESGLNPRDRDTDHDGLPDGVELDRDTDPFNPDTDGDHKRDGEDKDPLHYNAGWTDALKGATCGDSDFLFCPAKDDPVRASTEYLTGQLLSGIFAVGDIRDIINALAHGKAGDALWSAVGFVPAAGDAAKFGRKITELIHRFPARKAELLTRPEEAAAVEVRAGRVRRGDRRRVQRAAEGRRVDEDDRPAARARQRPQEAGQQREAERAHAELERGAGDRERGRQVLAGRPALGGARGRDRARRAQEEPEHRRDLRRPPTGRPPVQRPGHRRRRPQHRPHDRRRGQGHAGPAPAQRPHAAARPPAAATYTQTQYEWLRDNPNRYLKPLSRSAVPGDREAARRLAGIVDNGDGYDVVIVNSRPAGKGGYGSGVDTATDNIRGSGRVGSLDLIDVQRP